MNAIRFLVDEDFDNDILRGLLRRKPDLDILSAVRTLVSAKRQTRKFWNGAAQENRVVLTHDVSTMTAHAYRRMTTGLPMSGLFVVSQSAPIAQVISDILLLAECSIEGESKNQVRYLPL